MASGVCPGTVGFLEENSLWGSPSSLHVVTSLSSSIIIIIIIIIHVVYRVKETIVEVYVYAP